MPSKSATAKAAQKSRSHAEPAKGKTPPAKGAKPSKPSAAPAKASKPAKHDSKPAKPAPKAPPSKPAVTSAKAAKGQTQAQTHAKAKEAPAKKASAAPPPPSKPSSKSVKAPETSSTKLSGKAKGAKEIPPAAKSSKGAIPDAKKSSKSVGSLPPAAPSKRSSRDLGKASKDDKRMPPPPPPSPMPRHRTMPIAPPAPKPPSMEERTASLEARLLATEMSFQDQYRTSLDMSWIYHDSAIEGVVYTFQELREAFEPPPAEPPPIPPVLSTESSMQPVFEEIRRHREALDYIRDYATKRRLPVTLDVVRKIFLILHPEEGDIKSVKYRKDIPQHRLYFHEYSPPDKIAYKVRQIVDWINDPETKKGRNWMRIAARAHYDLLRVFPFQTDSGKVARLLMNLMLLRAGYPPAIIHSTERQRYYEALKGANVVMNQIVQEAMENNLASIEKLLDQYDANKKGSPSTPNAAGTPSAPSSPNNGAGSQAATG